MRCSDAARERGDTLAGTATKMPGWVLLEEPGPWGHEAWLDARLPAGLGAATLDRAARANVRPLLARRPQRAHRPVPDRPRRAWLARSDAYRPWLATAWLEDPRDLLDLALDTTGDEPPAGWERDSEPFFGVCTHGRHDACCAIRGLPVAAALHAAEPEATWEVSHIGGDRFAANLLVLPEGLYYGGLDPAVAVDVAATHRRGRLDLDHLRGRSCWPMPVQAALIALRRQTGDTGLDEPLDVRADQTRAGWEVTATMGGEQWAVDVAREAPPAVPLTCSARAPGIPWVHRTGTPRPTTTPRSAG